MVDKQFSVAAPIELPNGKTVWATLGRAFESGPNSKYAMKISLSALPVTAFKGDMIELYLFELKERGPQQRREEPPPPSDEHF